MSLPRLREDETFTLDIYLFPAKYQASEVVVETSRETPYLTTPTLSLTTEEMKALPVLVETDVQRAMQLLPGVSVSNDYSSQLVVRGGDQSQTVTVLDDVPIYNTFHFGSIFSTVNSDLISNADLFASAYAPNYGGAVSSIFSLRTKDIAPDKFHLNGGLSLVSSKAFIEAPLGNGSLQISARRTYFDLVGVLLSAKDVSSGASFFGTGFYDLYGKYQWQASAQHQLSASILFTRDNLNSVFLAGEDRIQPQWGNLLGSFAWKWRINSLQELSATAYTTSSILRTLSFRNFPPPDTADIDNSVLEQGIKSKFEWTIGQHQLSTGLDAATQQFRYNWNIRGMITGLAPPAQEIFFDNAPAIYQNAFSRTKVALFVLDKISLDSQLTLSLGGRAEYFSEQSRTFISPFARADYKLNEHFTLSASYGRYYQSLVTQAECYNSFSLAAFKTFFLPQRGNVPMADHFTLGITYSEVESGFTLSAEAYRLLKRDMPFVSIMDNSLQTYDEESIGIDVLARYKQGAFSRWLSYSLGQAVRTQGNTQFPGQFDQRHTVKAFASYRLWSSLDIAATWVLATGLPYSTPTGQFIDSNGNTKPLYTQTNNQRTPLYHRLDLTLSHSFSAWGGLLRFYLTLVNAYSNNNSFTIATPANNTWPAMPIAIPVVGVIFEF